VVAVEARASGAPPGADVAVEDARDPVVVDEAPSDAGDVAGRPDDPLPGVWGVALMLGRRVLAVDDSVSAGLEVPDEVGRTNEPLCRG